MESFADVDFDQMFLEDAPLHASFSDFHFIGKGSQAAVMRATYQRGLSEEYVPGETFALKLFPRLLLANDIQGKKRKELEREIINNTTLLLHPHIVGYRVSFLSRFFLVVVMEYVECRYADNGVMSMNSVLNDDTGLEYWVAKNYFQQLVLAMDYSHARGIAHRDLKPEHCLLFGPFGEGADKKFGKLKVCDWGLSKGDYSMVPQSRVGTPGYWAPEVLVASWERLSYDAMAADCFSVGVIFYNFLFGRRAFPPAADPEGDAKLGGDGESLSLNAMRRTAQGFLRREHLPCEIPEGCFEVLQGLLEVDIQKRWTMADVVDTDWFQVDLPEAAVGLTEQCLRSQVADIKNVRRQVKDQIAVAPSFSPQGDVQGGRLWLIGNER